MLIWSCGLNLRPKSPRGNQNKPIFNSWQVDLILFEPADPRFVALKAKANNELSHLDRSWHFQKVTPAQIQLDQMRKAGYGDQRFIVKHLHPWWTGSKGYDDYMQLESLAMAVMPFEPSKLRSDNTLALSPLIDVAQLVRVINFGSVLGGQTFDVDPQRYIPVVDYDNDDETRYRLTDCVQRNSVKVQHKLDMIYGIPAVGYPETEALFGRYGLDEFATPEQKEKQLIVAQFDRLNLIKNGTTTTIEPAFKKTLGKPDLDKLEQLNWGYSGSYRQDQNSIIKYFLTDVNSNLTSRFETGHLVNYDNHQLYDPTFDFGPADLSNTYYKIKDKKVEQYVDHFMEDENGKTKRVQLLDTINFMAQEYALTSFMSEVKKYVDLLKG